MSRSLLPEIWNVPQVFRDRLGAEPGRQRTMEAEGHLLLVLHAPPAAEDDERAGRFFWRSPDGDWRSNCLGGGMGALAKHLAEYQARLNALEGAEKIAANARGYYEVLRQTAPLARASRNLHATLQHAREIVPEDRALIPCRDDAYDLERESELLLTSARFSLDFHMAEQSEKTAAEAQQLSVAGHRLNVLAAIFLPTATLASLLGMNVQHGLETSPPPYAFIAVLVAGLLIGFVLKGFLSRKS